MRTAKAPPEPISRRHARIAGRFGAVADQLEEDLVRRRNDE
jgi:hypothetical protein